ncbi:MAG: acetyl-CoA acetyltransferase [Dehalococcoidia bacterium]|nr:acetyl-CoA acetyltransferase [Dehalococcoidia bacterium]
MSAANLPVIVGAGQYVNRSREIADAVEPLEMMATVARAAEDDAGVQGLLAHMDSLQVVNIIAWPYSDTTGLLAERLGASPAQRVYTAVGGDTPQRLINKTAEAIVRGETRLALICGAEVLASTRLARKLGASLPWHERGIPQEMVGDSRSGVTEVESRHGAVMPTRVYPLFENALRAHLGLGLEEHRRRLGALYERFSAVAAQNPYAWFPKPLTADEITTVSPANRMVCFPYPKRMNAIMEVNQAAGVILTGSQTASELGIPEDRWVYLWGCGEANDKWFVSDRVNLHSSPAIRAATSRALGMAGLSVDEIELFDLYSCFPSAVQLAMGELGLSMDDPRSLTLTGGLAYAGGPGNNYVTHSVAAAVARLRESPGAKALVTGLGWFATKHSAGVYSASRPPNGRWQRTDPEVDQAPIEAMESPPTVERADGAAIIESYTVQFNREGEPEMGIVIGRLSPQATRLGEGNGEKPGARFIANTPVDADLMRAMTREEFVGASGRVSHDTESGRNVFSP